MGPKRWTDRQKVRSAVLTLRMTNEEMLRFKLAALKIGKKRARIVRERVADLIGMTMPEAATPAGNKGGEAVINDGAVVDLTATADIHEKGVG